MRKILLVEDQILTQMGIRMALEKSTSDCVITAIAANVAEALAALQEHPDIDLVLLDILLPDGSGIDVMKYIRTMEKSVKVLILSADISLRTISQLCELGMNGFVSKFSDIQTIETAITTVMNGGEYYGKDIAEIICDVMVANNQAKQIFTERELQIIRLCTEGYSAKQIANELYISIRTVETHKANIFKKLGFSNTNQLIKYAMEKGIIKG